VWPWTFRIVAESFLCMGHAIAAMSTLTSLHVEHLQADFVVTAGGTSFSPTCISCIMSMRMAVKFTP
jgi:hypothetical protein